MHCKITRMECIPGRNAGWNALDWKPGWNALETRMECIGNQEGMHWKPGRNAMETRMECIGNQDGMHWKPGWNAMETRMECNGNQEGMHWKPGWNAMETRMECNGNQDGMQWKPGWNAMETRKECIGNQDEMHWKPSKTRMECIPNRGGNALKPGSRWFLNRGMRYFRIITTPVFFVRQNHTCLGIELTDSSTKNGLKTKRNMFGKPMDGFIAGNPLHFPCMVRPSTDIALSQDRKRCNTQSGKITFPRVGKNEET